MAHNRRKSNGRYIVPKKEIERLIKENKRKCHMFINYTNVYGQERDYQIDSVTDALNTITDCTFDYIIQIDLILNKPFKKVENIIVWQGNQHMVDLYILNQL